MKNPVDIIILKYGLPKYESMCIGAVASHTEYPYHLTVIDNFPTSYNVGQLWNQLIERSGSDLVCLLNNDAIVPPGWLEKMVQVVNREKNVGAVGPLLTHAFESQRVENYTKDYQVINLTKEYPKEMLGGSCLLLNKEAWKKSGKFPEDFGFYAQETYLMYCLNKVGYNQYVRRDLIIWHEGGASAKASGMDIAKERRLGRKNYEKAKADN